jgi:peptidoglycan hydrolase FlgJ
MLGSATPSIVDTAGLARLRERIAADDPAALDEAAVQFEALMIATMLASARAAGGGEGILDSETTEQYLDLMDRQVALEVARNGGFGLSKWLAEGVRAEGAVPATVENSAEAPLELLPSTARSGALPFGLQSSSRQVSRRAAREAFDPETPAAFVETVLPHARRAAEKLGVPAGVLVAQAALETGWGRGAPKFSDGRPAYNVFGIKADAGWKGGKVTRTTLEYVDGAAERRREQFRAYSSLTESFDDYVDLIQSSPRYAPALTAAADPEHYVRALVEAGYATDPRYGNKWLAILGGNVLEDALGSAQDSPSRDDIESDAARRSDKL